jgi:hypothetical protein
VSRKTYVDSRTARRPRQVQIEIAKAAPAGAELYLSFTRVDRVLDPTVPEPDRPEIGGEQKARRTMAGGGRRRETKPRV